LNPTTVITLFWLPVGKKRVMILISDFRLAVQRATDIAGGDPPAALAPGESDGASVFGSVAGRSAPGIDDFGHRPVFTDTEFVADKKPDVCPAGGRSRRAKQD
jgi:hypothetical protein